MAGSSSSAPDPPECPHALPAHHAGSSGFSTISPPQERQQDPAEYPTQSSAKPAISVAPTQCDDHSTLLIKLPPPKISSESPSVNLSTPRRRSSVDPPEVLQPIDELSSPVKEVNASLAASSADGDDETIEQLSLALALVPYDEPDTPGYPSIVSNELFDPVESSCPQTTDNNNHALVLHEESRKHGASTRDCLVPYQQPKQHYPTRTGFDHCFITVPPKERLSALFATLRRNASRKVIVVLSTWESAKFHALLFRQLELFLVSEIHEHMEKDAVDSYDRFLYTYPGVLFASDIALREFDIPPNVDYILQYEPPMHPTEYIYRLSSARLFETSCHKALLFLSPQGKEMNFIQYFQEAGVELSELQARKVSMFQPKVEKMIYKHTALNEAAWRAFRAYVVAYESHSHQDVWYKPELDEEGTLTSFANPHFPSYVSSSCKEDKIVKELIHKNLKVGHHRKKEERKGRSCEEQNPQASWMRGKEKTWRSGQNKSWMNKEKSWKHAHSSSGLNAAAERD